MKSTVTDAASQWLEFRHDTLQPGDQLDAAYAQAKDLRAQLTQSCSTISMMIDGHTLTMPIDSITVRVLTDRDRMRVPPTDQVPDRLAQAVSNNPSNKLVLSTKIMIRPDPRQSALMAAAHSLDYVVCGQNDHARPAELDGLKRVHAWAYSED